MATKRNVIVANRLKEIKTFKETLTRMGIEVSFDYIPGAHNIADIISRGATVKHLTDIREEWLNGPKWISMAKV